MYGLDDNSSPSVSLALAKTWLWLMEANSSVSRRRNSDRSVSAPDLDGCCMSRSQDKCQNPTPIHPPTHDRCNVSTLSGDCLKALANVAGYVNEMRQGLSSVLRPIALRFVTVVVFYMYKFIYVVNKFWLSRVSVVMLHASFLFTSGTT